MKFFFSINFFPTSSSSYYWLKQILFIISLFILLKMTPAGAKSTRAKYGTFLNSFHPDVKWLQLRLEWINNKIDKNEVSVLFNQIYIYRYIFLLSFFFLFTFSFFLSFFHLLLSFIFYLLSLAFIPFFTLFLLLLFFFHFLLPFFLSFFLSFTLYFLFFTFTFFLSFCLSFFFSHCIFFHSLSFSFFLLCTDLYILKLWGEIVTHCFLS